MPAPPDSTAALSMPPGEVRGDGSYANLAGDSALLLQLSVAPDAMYVATQDDAHVPLRGMALMTGAQDSVAALSMPLGRVQGGLHASVASKNDPLLQLSAAPDAAHVAPLFKPPSDTRSDDSRYVSNDKSCEGTAASSRSPPAKASARCRHAHP